MKSSQASVRMKLSADPSMKPIGQPKRKPGIKQKKATPRRKLFPDVDDMPPRPAFRPFALEDEWHGRRRMRGLGKCIDTVKLAPNSLGEIDVLYMEAIDQCRSKWELCYNRNGEMVYQREYATASAEDAANDLYKLAKNATTYLTMLVDRNPELCRKIAATKSEWPVLADLTEKEWQHPIAETISKLELGKDIEGYLLSARTADQNVIRCWATAIYETLFQTRFDYKRAFQEPGRHTTTEGCPEWVHKTLELPKFTKANARKWAKLGEEMLLQQKPDFLESPDLTTEKQSWTRRAIKDSRSGKASVRAIHREAFEDFAKELKNIAPERELWRGEW